MKKEIQLKLPLITHDDFEDIIYQREIDGYVNATIMCKISGKQMKHYNQEESTKEFIKELSSVVNIPDHELVQSIHGSIPEYQGT